MEMTEAHIIVPSCRDVHTSGESMKSIYCWKCVALIIQQHPGLSKNRYVPLVMLRTLNEYFYNVCVLYHCTVICVIRLPHRYTKGNRKKDKIE